MSINKSNEKVFADWRKAYLERIGQTEEEHAKRCQQYRDGYECCAAIVKQHTKKRNKYEQALATTDIDETYSTDSTLHRGLYSPGWLKEAVVGRQKKGRSCKKEHPQRAYTYFWDKEGRLIATQRGNEKEFITYNDQSSVGVLYFGKEILQVTKCAYDSQGRIQRCAVALCDGDENIIEYDEETYTYTAEGTVEVEWARLDGHLETVTIDRYVFKVHEGHLTEYSILMFGTEDMTERSIEDRTYLIKKRIRVNI